MADGGVKNYEDSNRRVKEKLLYDVGEALKKAGSFDFEKSH